ncbi:MAG: 30S ribosomal protein S21 [Spirochaetaceae bacterium]|nr:30S ribosomal protein S21 [Spirochaetaceae bacterium]
MAHIDVYHDEDLEKAIKRFKRKVEKEGIIREFKKRQYFRKPSILKHEQKKERVRKELKKIRKIEKRNMY